MKTCFIIMPITTPNHCLDQYKGDSDHFKHVLDHLFKPAITAAGMEPIAPIVKGSEIIHSEIIKNIETADLVLCDMSILNPNVFFELGIRTALNKSVAMIKDDATPKVPFDINMINHHTYKCAMDPWNLDDDVELLKVHLGDCMKNGQENALWGYFSMSQQAVVPKDAPNTEKQLGYLIKQVETLRRQTDKIVSSDTTTNIERSIIVRAMMSGVHETFRDHGITSDLVISIKKHMFLTTLTLPQIRETPTSILRTLPVGKPAPNSESLRQNCSCA
jgi:hypothetical protein